MIRKEYNVMSYSQIAILHYWEAKQAFKKLSYLEYLCNDSQIFEMAIMNNSIITVTFSAMALEAFMNDFAATILGDKFYYENFEMLRPIGKLQLISKFILNKNVDKGSALFSLVDSLFKERNNYVHSKSKACNSIGMTEEEYKSYLLFVKTDEGKEFLSQDIKIDLLGSKEMVKVAFLSLCALREVGKFIDEHDAEHFALVRLLLAGGYLSASSEEITHIQEVQKELEIPTLES